MTRFRLLAALLTLLLALVACGTTEPAAGQGPAGESQAGSGAGTITVTDSRGKTVTLNGPAKRLVALEWSFAEDATALGVPPVGVADLRIYPAWVQTVPLPREVTDVGVRGEPSIDAIASLRPDLVLTTPDVPEGAIAQIESFVPVLVIRPADASDPIGRMRENVNLVAKVTGTEAKAAQLLAEFDAALADGAARIAAAGRAGQRFAFSDAYLDGGRVSIRPFTKGALVAAVAERLGLVNAWTMPGDPDYGLASTDVEGLTTLGDVEFLYFWNEVSGPDVYAQLTDNPVWRSLPFVQQNKVTRLPDGIWVFGGPTSMRAYIDALVNTLTQRQ